MNDKIKFIAGAVAVVAAIICIFFACLKVGSCQQKQSVVLDPLPTLTPVPSAPAVPQTIKMTPVPPPVEVKSSEIKHIAEKK